MAGISVIGGGAWGTALACVGCRAGTPTRLWVREPEVATAIAESRENSPYLPGVPLDPALFVTTDLIAALDAAAAVVLAVPSQHLRAVARRLAGHLMPDQPLVVAAKGVELLSCRTMAEVVGEELPANPLAILSGPTFAAEVARGLPTAVTLATHNPDVMARVLSGLGAPGFRIYRSDDPAGCEIGGAVKNVLAIACGIVAGRRLGDNARAALITRGLAEMVRLAIAKGGRAETLMGLSGLGDLTLTCTSSQSRNCSLGEALGRGEALEAILAGRRSVAEGVDSAASIDQLASRLGIEMPIVAGVNAILHRGAGIDDEIRKLLARPIRAESGS